MRNSSALHQDTTEPADELDLVDALKSGEQKNAAFRLLLERYQKRLYWHIRKLVGSHEDTDDVLQNTFIRIYKGIDGFDAKSSLHTWMYRIAYNESMRHLEKQGRRLTLASEEATKRILENLKEDVYFEGTEIQLKLHKALLELPEKQRQVFQMKYFDDLKFREISEILGTTEGGLKSMYHTAKNKIEGFLTQRG